MSRAIFSPKPSARDGVTSGAFFLQKLAEEKAAWNLAGYSASFVKKIGSTLDLLTFINDQKTSWDDTTKLCVVGALGKLKKFKEGWCENKIEHCADWMSSDLTDARCIRAEKMKISSITLCMNDVYLEVSNGALSSYKCGGFS
jgi:hypothetical protein